MAKIATKVRIATAACAIAAAAAMVPAPVAQAAPATPAPTALGGSLCLFGIGNNCEAEAGTVGDFGGLFYIGGRDATPPERSDFLILHPVIPLSLIPIIGPPLAGWFATLDFEVCFAGLSARVGPYGTVTASIGRGC